MDYGLFFSAILGSAGFFGLIQFLVTRHDRKDKDLQDIKAQLKKIRESQRQNDIRVTRIELKGLIRDDPDNIDAILQVAETYFIELDGNAYAHAMFEQWATEHNVAIGWLPKLKKGVKNGKKK